MKLMFEKYNISFEKAQKKNVMKVDIRENIP